VGELNKTAIATLVERTTRYTMLVRTTRRHRGVWAFHSDAAAVNSSMRRGANSSPARP
jgi:IS30 family transposase